MCKDEMVKDYSKTWLNFLGEREEKEWVFLIFFFSLKVEILIYHIEKEVASHDVEMASPEVSRQSSRDSTKTTSPLTVSSGIMTKRGPIVEEVTAYGTVFSV